MAETWLVKEIRCPDTWASTGATRGWPRFSASRSPRACPRHFPNQNGAGLGTIGLPPGALEQLARSAGSTRFRMHDFGGPANLYYEIRP